MVESMRRVSGSPLYPRAYSAAENFKLYPMPRHWIPEGKSFALFSGLMGGVQLSERTPTQLKVLSGFFYEAMYANRYVDPLVRRAKNGSSGLHFIEKFWNIPEHIEKLTTEARVCGFSERSQHAIGDWFHVNRIVNFYLHQLAIGSDLSYESYGEESDMDAREHQIFALIRPLIVQQSKESSPLNMSILLRSISSMGLARSLVILSQNNDEGDNVDEEKLRRTGGMIMATQIMDDFGTPVKDARMEIGGMVRVAFPGKTLKEGKLRFDDKDTEIAMRIAREVIGGCIEVIDVDSNNRWKSELIRQGLIILGGLASGAMVHKYGGTEYSAKALLQGLVDAFFKERVPEKNDIRSVTTKALIKSLELMQQIH